ncbi:hypothetical protein [Corynebacterium sp.]|uniref:hypothetical protein n=1 Tax=Corynebacterium sp. TaxID=1720 RepID=UPI002A915ACF|nr:hypothetical protein [Corynebacterium sp.]MDY5785069.1 hypothetical protein [Corynebacterium sp.]
MHRAHKAGTLAALGAASLMLAACGGATVDSSDVTASATQTATSAATTGASTSTATSTETSMATTTAASAAEAPANERPAREVSSIPEMSAHYSPEEDAFLGELRNKGININGVEDQLTATGFSLCDGTTFTRDAVAGQLVEQRRTNLDPAAAAQLIDDTAHANLC